MTDTTITWLGHAAFLVESGSTTLLVDPFLTGNPKAVTGADDYTPTAILVTHAHNDHVGDAVAISQRTGAPVITTNELGVYLGTRGANAIPANIGGTIAFDGGSVKLVPAVHTSAFNEDGAFVAPGAAAGLVVRVGGKTIYFAGDTALFGDMELIGSEGLDVAVVPIGGHFTMDPDDAVKAVSLLHPAVVIPCHFGTFPPIAQDPAAFAAAVEAQTSARAIVLEPGSSASVERA